MDVECDHSERFQNCFLAVSLVKVKKVCEKSSRLIIFQNFLISPAFNSLNMSTEENMNSSNIESTSDSPTEPEAPIEVSVAKSQLDVYIRSNSKLTNNKIELFWFVS